MISRVLRVENIFERRIVWTLAQVWSMVLKLLQLAALLTLMSSTKKNNEISIEKYVLI